jgi:hypothetical protein
LANCREYLDANRRVRGFPVPKIKKRSGLKKNLNAKCIVYVFIQYFIMAFLGASRLFKKAKLSFRSSTGF